MAKGQLLLIPPDNNLLCADPHNLDRYDTHARFVIERHMVYLRRARGLDKPWTQDPVLLENRFCNIYRQLDTVSIWIIDNIIRKYEDNPNLPVMLAMARLINWPDTLQELIDEKVFPVSRWDWKKCYNVLEARKQRGEKVVTGAYIVNSIFPQGFDSSELGNTKVHYIPRFGIDPLWATRKELAKDMKVGMEHAVKKLSTYHGWAAFMSYQVIVDLSYSENWLANAPDLNTFTSPGPGTRKGQQFLTTGVLGKSSSFVGVQEQMIAGREEANKRIQALVPKTLWTGDFRTGFAPMEMSNYSNSLCEFSKWMAVSTGSGQMRASYRGKA